MTLAASPSQNLVPPLPSGPSSTELARRLTSHKHARALRALRQLSSDRAILSAAKTLATSLAGTSWLRVKHCVFHEPHRPHLRTGSSRADSTPDPAPQPSTRPAHMDRRKGQHRATEEGGPAIREPTLIKGGTQQVWQCLLNRPRHHPQPAWAAHQSCNAWPPRRQDGSSTSEDAEVSTLLRNNSRVHSKAQQDPWGRPVLPGLLPT
ncbi:hypothetical protein CB1_000114014 [Camelus ferus]|nr:hypothetical protein CB1_000114014 [Camelus ferus]